MTRTRRAAAAVACVAAIIATAGCTISTGGGSPESTLNVWTSYTGPGQLSAMDKQNEIFEASHPGITVNVIQVPGEQMDQKMLASASTGVGGPDVMLNNVVVDFPLLVEGGVLKDLTSEWNSYEDKDLFPDSSIWKTADDEVYNVMSYANLVGLYYNEDILDEYGIAPPTTVDELEAALATIAEDGKYQGLAQSMAPNVEGAWLFMPLLLGKGIDYCNFDGPEVLTEFERIEQWANDGYLPRGSATWSQNDAWQRFMTGDFAFAINGNWNLGDAAANASFEYGTSVYPASGGESVVFPGGEGLGIGENSDKPELAWEYIEEAWLAPEAGVIDFVESGQVPVRSDVASDSQVIGDPYVEPFVQAVQNAAYWPNNPNTAEIQNALGATVSAVTSGQTSAADAAETAIADVADELEAGGGDC